MYIHLDTLHARNLKFGMYLPCMTFNRFNVAILKKKFSVLLWPPKIQYGRHFGHIFAFGGRALRARIVVYNLYHGKYMQNFKILEAKVSN